MRKESLMIILRNKGTDRLHFFYDGGGVPISFDYNGSIYYYLRNAQGDITGIIDNNGTQVISYSYNTWGVMTDLTGTGAQTIGRLNPFALPWVCLRR